MHVLEAEDPGDTKEARTRVLGAVGLQWGRSWSTGVSHADTMAVL